MILIATGFIPLSPLSIASTMVMWESSQWLGRNIVQSTGKKNSKKAWIGALAAVIQLEYRSKWRWNIIESINQPLIEKGEEKITRPQNNSILEQICLWEKEKMLVTTISSFSHDVFYPFTAMFHELSDTGIVIKCKILSSGKQLTLGLPKRQI